MNYILCDPINIEKYYPFTLTRPFCEMRVFGGTIKERWERLLGCEVSQITRTYLSKLYPTKLKVGKNTLIFSDSPINLDQVKTFELFVTQEDIDNKKDWFNEIKLLKLNYQSIINPVSYFLDPSYFLKNYKSNVDCSSSPFLNDEEGPIFIEEDVTIMEGAMIRGPVYICKGTVIKMGSKIYGPTIIGPFCKIAGEISNCIFLGYSNKAHHGFIGHSIIGEWCNIGAGTSNSNLKNNYETVKMWDYNEKKFKDTQEQFLGLFFGDHSKCAINTSFNTGTTVGINCNIFGSSFPRNYVPSFSWGGSSGYKDYNVKKAIETAKKVMSRRSIKMSSHYENMLIEVFDMTSSFRS